MKARRQVKKYLSTRDAAKELGVSDSRIRHLILAGRLKAQKLGWVCLILPEDLDAVRDRKPGRPWQKGKEQGHGQA